jgi:hypothetical protein
MFENIGTQQQQVATQDQQAQMQMQGYDPYALPIDPYIQQRPSTNWNTQMMNKLFDPSISAQDITAGEYATMYRSVLSDLRRIPNLSPVDKRRIIRDYADIEELHECDGVQAIVRSMLRSMLLEVSAHSADGSSLLNGLTGVSAIITQRSQMEQQVKIPQQQERKKIMGIF